MARGLNELRLQLLVRTGLQMLVGDANYRLKAQADVVIGSRPVANADPHSAASLPDCRAAPAGAVFLNSSDDAFVYRGIAERYQYLIQDHVIQNVETSSLQLLAEASCVTRTPGVFWPKRPPRS